MEPYNSYFEQVNRKILRINAIMAKLKQEYVGADRTLWPIASGISTNAVVTDYSLFPTPEIQSGRSVLCDPPTQDSRGAHIRRNHT